MKGGSLFSSIGGLDRGLEAAGVDVAWQAEVNPYRSRVLAHHWPGIPNLGDVTSIDWSKVEPVDLIFGGFPCQPWSQAGLRRGTLDDRWLWPAFARAIRHLRPRYVLVENVPGLLTGGLEHVLGDLAELGFDAEWSCVSACSVGAPHRRRRVFVLAYPQGTDVPGEMPSGPFDGKRRSEPRGSRRGEGRSEWWLSEPSVDRMADGVPRSVVRDPLEALGDAVVPQVAEFVGRRLLGVVA